MSADTQPFETRHSDTLGGFLADAAARFADNEAIVFEGQRYTYTAVLAEAQRVAANLGDAKTVAVVMRNRPEMVFAIFGAALAGAVVAPLSTFAPKPELDFMLKDCGADLVLDNSVRPTEGTARPETHRTIAPDDDGVIIYSSGTTSRPKGMVHSHRAHVISFRNNAAIFGRNEQSRVWTAFPLFWTAGFDGAMGATLAAGGCLVLQETFEPGAALKLLAAERVNEAYCLPHQTQAMAEHPDWATTDLSPMTKVFGKSAFARHPKVDGDTNWQNPTGYGMSETCSFSAAHAFDTPRETMKQSVGAVIEGNEIRITDDGEILVKGPTLFNRYVGKTRDECFDADGFFHTGDTGHLNDHGHLVFDGRMTEMIKTGGANVSPAEIEVALRACEPVLVARIIGIPDDRLGELVVACIELKSEATEQDIVDFLKARVASYKVPKKVLFFAEGEIPMTASKTKVRDDQLFALVTERLNDV